MLTITPESHVDHNLTEMHLAFIRERFADRDAFFIETVDLPADLPSLPCGLYGPTMGDDSIVNGTIDAARGTRKYASRLIDRPMRTSRSLTVIAGPHGDASCVLYTAFGGPQAPREPGDPDLGEGDERTASVAFWAIHALSIEAQS